MPQITKEEYLRRAVKFVEAHKDSYTPRELRTLLINTEGGINNPFAWDIIRQVLDEVGYTDKSINMYEGFMEILQKNFDINTDIVEIAGGIVPSLAKKIALRQKSGTVTVYDPRLITDIEKPDNLILKQEMFGKDTPLGNAKLVIGFMPCDATTAIINAACTNQIDFIVALCEGGLRKGYEWLEDDDEWIAHIKYLASLQVKKYDLGTLQEASLERYSNPYPVIYNKRRKS